jgi:hypothetical protein
MLAKHNRRLKCIGLPPKKITSLLRPVKYDLELRIPGVYIILCEFGQVYIRLVDL